MLDFSLGGVHVPIHAALDFQQTYSPLGGSSVLRLANGQGVKQTHWSRVSTTLTGGGWIPPGLDGLDYSQPLLLECAAPRGIVTTASSVRLPSARRTDGIYAPIAWALVGEAWKAIDLSIADDTASFVPVGGATQYRVHYYPAIQVFAAPPRSSGDLNSANYQWTLTAEEI